MAAVAAAAAVVAVAAVAAKTGCCKAATGVAGFAAAEDYISAVKVVQLFFLRHRCCRQIGCSICS